ncbi:MAG: HAD hydrolase-like protein [Pseudomonadota bacterium]
MLSDLDGCLVSEGQAFADAQTFVQRCGARLWVVSNNSTHRAAELSAFLSSCGLEIAPERILLAGQQALLHLAKTHPGARLAVFASTAVVQDARLLGFDLDSGRPDIVLLCRDPQFSLNRLDLLTAYVRQGATLWVANMDVAHPGLRGQPIAETGAVLAAVRAILGDVPARSIGKPQPHMIQTALKRAGVSAGTAVFVGDNAATDGAGARAAQVPFVHLTRAEGQT